VVKSCGGQDSNPRTPAGADLESFRGRSGGGSDRRIDVSEEDLELYVKHKGMTTCYKHTIRCKLLVRKFLENQKWKISYSDTLSYFNEIRNQCSPKTYRDNVLIVRDFLRFLGFEWSNRIKLPKIPHRLPVFVRTEQIEKLLSEIETIEDPIKSQQLRAFTILGATTGMRSEEIYKLTPDEIDLKNRSIRLTNTKSGEDRMVFFNEDAKKELEILLEWGNLPLFPYRIIQRFYYTAKDRCDGLLPKYLRKYFSTTSDKLGMPTGVKKRLMGHSTNGDIDLQHYSALTFDDLKAIYNRYWDEVQISL